MFINTKNCLRTATPLRFILILIAWTASSVALAQSTVFTADFQGGVPVEFSTGTTSNEQIGAEAVNQGLSTYLGKFTLNGSTTLTLTGLPTHSFVRLDVDVYFFNSWDGSNGTYGPDYFSLAGDVTFAETFTNHQGSAQTPQQTYPALADVYLNNDGSALASFGSSSNTFAYFDLGPTSSGTGFIVPHNGGTFTVTFGGPTTQSDEQWGIDNVKVTVCDTQQNCQPGAQPPPPPETPIPVLTDSLLIAGLILLFAAIGMVALRRSS